MLYKVLPWLALMLLCGCKQETVVSYKIPKEVNAATRPTLPPPTGQNQMPGLAAQTEGFKTPRWNVPSHWEIQEPGAMRKGSFLFRNDDETAEITALVFPGNVGGMLANINRWAGQVEAPELNQTQVDKLETTPVDSEVGVVIHLQGPVNGILGVIIERTDHTWFFKMMGPNKLIESQSAAFNSFVQSVKFQ